MPGRLGLRHGLHQQMNAQPQRDIERHRAIFDEQVVVALAAIDDRDRSVVALCRRSAEPVSSSRPMDGRPGNRVVRPRDADESGCCRRA